MAENIADQPEPEAEDEAKNKIAVEERLMFREWTPLSNLLEKIPTKAQKGLTILDLKLTCISSLEEFLVIGTNVGLVYLYDRRIDTLQRLKLEVSTSPISCVKIVSSEDFMVAAGNICGHIVVFQIPKEHDNKIYLQEQLARMEEPQKKKCIQRFDIKGLHKSVISCLEWSTNGMKLISGDVCGCVVLTEIDYDLIISRSSILLDEKYEIVQLNYSRMQLLISSTFRSIIYSLDDRQSHKIGSQERKILGNFGTIFEPGLWRKNIKIYTTRPGLRIWISDLSGKVEQTLLLKESIANPQTEIPVINPTNIKTKIAQNEIQFGSLHNFMEKYLVTYHKDILFIIDPLNIKVIAACHELKSILSISVHKNEIFVLESDRSIVRISNVNEEFGSAYFSKQNHKPSSQKQFHDIMTTSFQNFTTSLSNDSIAQFTSKLKNTAAISSNILNTIKNVMEPTEDVQDGVVESDSNVNDIGEITQDKNSDPSIPPPDRFAEISKQSFENVLNINEMTKPRKKPKVKKKMPIIKPSSSSFIPKSDGKLTNENLSDAISVSSSTSNSEHGILDMSAEHQQSNYSLISSQGQGHQRKMSLESIQSSKSTSTSGVEDLSNETSCSPNTSADNFTDDFHNIISTINLIYGQGQVAINESLDLHSKEELLAHKLKWPELLPDSDNLKSNSSKMDPEKLSVDSDQFCGFVDDEESLRTLKCLESSTDSNLLAVASTEIERSEAETEELKLINMTSLLGFNDQITDTNTNTNKTKDNGEGKSESIVSESENENVSQKSSDNSIDYKTTLEKYSSLESKMSFGPPSGSSITETKSLLDELEKKPLEDENHIEDNEHLFNSDLSMILDMQVDAISGIDNWLEYKLPSSVAKIATCESYITCIDLRNNVYYSEIGKLSLHWIKADFKASEIGLASDGSVVWRIENGTLFKLISPSRNGPFCTTETNRNKQWMLICDNVVNIGVEIGRGIAIFTDGTIKITFTPNNPSFTTLTNIPRTLKSISILNNYIFGLSFEGKIYYFYIKAQSSSMSMSTVDLEESSVDLIDWDELHLNAELSSTNTSTSTIASICLGPCNSLWIFNNQNQLFLVEIPPFKVLSIWNGNRSSPENFWKISLSELITDVQMSNAPPSIAKNWTSKLTQSLKPEKLISLLQSNKGSPIISGSSCNIWFSFVGANSIHVNKKCVIGDRWNRVLFEGGSSLTWKNVFGESIYKQYGLMWLLNPKGKLCYCCSSGGKIQSLELPCDEPIVCISAAPETLWILNTKGQIFARRNISSMNNLGTNWGRINTSHIDKVHLVHISCGSEVAWAVDNQGKIYMRIGLLEPTSFTDSIPAWFPVEDSNQQNPIFTKVYVGTFKHMVWALDNCRNIYLREGIFPELAIGTSWLKITGIEATKLSISDKAVWALSPKGKIYRRNGISDKNSAGENWRKISGIASLITSSVSDDLWALDSNGYLNKLSQKVFKYGNDESSQKPQALDEEDCEWELV